MKTINSTLTAFAKSINHGGVDVNFAITVNHTEGSTTATIICPEGFDFGKQTSGVSSTVERKAFSEIENRTITLFSKKSLSKLGTDFLVLYKKGTERNKKDRFICHFKSWEISDLCKSI